MEKIISMWSGLKKSVKIFIVIAVAILIYALINNIFN
tara:strand:+ start:105 stop:215 length:111 start_codon:yes stop_codon:yes gene_type:complete